MCGTGGIGTTLRDFGNDVGDTASGFAHIAKLGLGNNDLAPFSSGGNEALRNLAPGLSIMALPFAALGGAALAGAGDLGVAGAGGAEVGGGAAGAGAGFGAEAGTEALAGGAATDEVAFLDATTPTFTPSADTAQVLGINSGFDSTNVGAYTDGMTMGTGASPDFGPGVETVPDPGPQDIPGPGSGGSGEGGGVLDQAGAMLKKLGLSPVSAGLLGISAAQALSKPKVPQAAKTLQDQAGPNAAAASATIQSGGTSSPAWASQKASIDATIDQQLKEQTAAMMQQAVNSGMGPDSQVTQQQINKLKNQLETQRQTLYAQAQAQNVQAALQTLGISDQALSQVAGQQFTSSNQAKQSAAQTAALALQLQALSNKGGSSASVVNTGSNVNA